MSGGAGAPRPRTPRGAPPAPVSAVSGPYRGPKPARRRARRRTAAPRHPGLAAPWAYLRDKGGRRFARAVDWVGLDAYPGDRVPARPAPIGTGYYDAMSAALDELRRCYMPIARRGMKVPIHVEENGWPTGPGRPEREQVIATRRMVAAVNDLRGLDHVTDYRWFDLT